VDGWQEPEVKLLNIGSNLAQIFHITAVQNLPSIIAAGGLHCDAVAAAHKLNKISVAHDHIKARRASKRVLVPPGGTLADYVPFYFAPRSPMLYAIHRNNVAGYDQGQEPIVHLVSSVDAVVAGGQSYVFTDGHAVIEMSGVFCELADLNRIDWQIMQAKYWNDTYQDGDRKRRRQAEFLVHRSFPWQLIAEIGVMTPRAAECVSRVLDAATHRPTVTVHPDWYY
jgi:hypothetical protein